MARKSFEELYQNVPAEALQHLLDFRRSHPYQHLEVAGVPWEYICSGAGPETLIILGGGMSLGETSFRTIERLEPRYRIISPSYPAIGRMDAVVQGLAAILDREGLTKAHVFGHSLGSAVGHVFVRLFPERVDKLILDGFGLYEPKHTRAARWFFKLPFPLIKAYYSRVMRRYFSGTGPEDAFMLAYMEELMTQLHTRESFMGQFNLLIDVFDHPERYRINQPVERPGQVLLILAKDDRGFTAEERQALIDTYPGGRVHWLVSGGHLAGFSRPEEFNAVFDQFLVQG